MTEREFGLGERDGERRGDWMCTHSGRQFWPLDPRPGDFFLDDIAHALAHICRYNGHCRYFYSVAQHSVACAYVNARRAEHMKRPDAWRRAMVLYTLTHDVPEAYIGDMVRPMKVSMREYCEVESLIEAAMIAWLSDRFTLPPFDDAMRQMVRDADNYLLTQEARSFMPAESVKKWHLPQTGITVPVGAMLFSWAPMRARDTFLRVFSAIINGEAWHLHGLPEVP